ncbi:MAG: mechanosensitive ion channel family protein [Moraxella sp.]|nr:mechanosensitive ion channel family protein [Moraxella sp.]
MTTFSEFITDITSDLHESVYLALGGSLEDQGYDWANRGMALASIAIKIAVLLLFISVCYWLLVYIIKHLKRLIHMSDRQLRIARSTLRYFWLVCCVLAVMTQFGATGSTLRATAKAAVWAGSFYVVWSSLGQILHWLFRRYELSESILQLLKNLLSVVLITVGVAMVMAQFGFDIVSIVAGLGIVGLAVGFAAQSTLANFIAGVAILLEQSFVVGDWIRIGDKEGRVVLISLRTTHVLDRDNVVIIIPNATVASSEVVNLTSKKMIRFDVSARIALHDDIDSAKAVMMAVLAADDAVLKQPNPMVTVSKIGEYAVEFIVRFWVTPVSVARIPVIKENLTEKLKKALDEADLTTPYPHMTLDLPNGEVLQVATPVAKPNEQPSDIQD